MCVGCFTGVEAVILNGAAGAVAARSSVGRLRERLTGRHPEQRRLLAYGRNAEFVASLGLDPVAVLGPPPRAGG